MKNIIIYSNLKIHASLRFSWVNAFSTLRVDFKILIYMLHFSPELKKCFAVQNHLQIFGKRCEKALLTSRQLV